MVPSVSSALDSCLGLQEEKYRALQFFLSTLALTAGNSMAEKDSLVYSLPYHFLLGSQPGLDCLSPQCSAWICMDNADVCCGMRAGSGNEKKPFFLDFLIAHSCQYTKLNDGLIFSAFLVTQHIQTTFES